MVAVEAQREHENPQELGERVVITEERGVGGLIVEINGDRVVLAL